MARVVVFKHADELLRLRELLYGDYEGQKRGLAICKAYQVRGPLPPSVHVTSLLIAAIHSDVPELDVYAIRQTYSMALIRFVNEILDAAQVGKAVIPLHALAAAAGLPSAFVELRHAATHEDLPSIYVLRDLANRAMAWLWDHFWVKQATHGAHTSVDKQKAKRAALSAAETSEPSDRIKELLREWRRLKRADPNKVPPPALLAKLRHEAADHEEAFLMVVMTRNILIPAGSVPIKGSSVVAMWLPLFSQLGPQFCQKLGARVLNSLEGREWPLNPSDPNEKRKYPFFEAWALALAPYLSPSTVEKLGGAPRPWNALVLATYAIERLDEHMFTIANEMAAITGMTIPHEFPVASLRSESTKKSTPGWIQVSDWTPRPLGVK